nr:hypothetical protein [Tanacetum cinerariifolium]
LLSEGIYYSLLYLTSLIPYPRFTKIIIGHYMTNFLEMSRRARDKYYNLKDDDLMKNIFNSGRYKDKVGMKIPDWMISKEMKQTKHYRMYVEVFRIDVPLTQSQPTESTQGMHRTPSASKSPNPKVDAAESIPMIDKADELILQDTLQVSLVKHKSRQKKEARENAALVEEHLASVEFKKMVEGQENVIDDSSILGNAEHNNPGTRLEPKSDKESPEVEFTDVVIPVNVYDTEEEEDEITDEVYKLKRSGKGKNIEESRITPFPTPIRSPRIHTDLVSLDTKKLQELTVTTSSSSSPNTKLSNTNRLLSLFKAKPARFKCYKSFFQELQGRYGYLFEHLRAKFMPRKSFVTLADHLHKAMANSLPTMVDKHIKEQVQQQVPEDQDDPHGDAHPEGENSAKRKKTSEYEAYVSGESLSGQENVQEQGPSTSEVSLNIDEAKLKKIADEMLRQRCTSEDEHQYHIDQTKNFLKSDIKVNFTAPTISFLEIKKHEMFSIIYEPVHGIIDKNIKKEKRVMRNLEIHKFCDATRNRVLEGLKSYNNDVKYGYIQRELTKDEVEYLKLFEEDIEDRLKYQRQMRR